MEPHAVTISDLVEYIYAQPDEKEVYLSSGRNNSARKDCEVCIMTQYGRDKGWEFTYTFVSSYSWPSPRWITNTDDLIAEVIDSSDIFVTLFDDEIMRKYSNLNTYRILKDCLKKEHKRLTKEEIIEETANFYNSTNRGYNPNNQTCLYLTPDGKNCAVGRCMIPESIELLGSANPAVTEIKWQFPNLTLDELLQPKYRGHTDDFWRKLQRFHDVSANWDENGLTEAGKKVMKVMKRLYEIVKSCGNDPEKYRNL